MKNSKLMAPYERAVSNGTNSYRLWRGTGMPDRNNTTIENSRRFSVHWDVDAGEGGAV